MSSLLTMQGIDKKFAGAPALCAASLEVGRGEVHALIGQNGAGKSTMIKILTGYHKRDAGTILFDGEPVAFGAPQEAQRAGISTIYQEINLVPSCSVTENICLGRPRRRFGLLDWSAMEVEARALLERFGISIDVRRPLMSYPTAVQQMVAIARAIGFKAKLVIMDEPTSSLDEQEVAILFGVIRQLKAEAVSVIFVSHKLDELYAVCDRITIMRDGCTVRTSTMRDLSKLDLVTTMLGRELGHALEANNRPTETATTQPLLRIDHLASGHKVRDVSLDVRQGEIVALAGLLGSGRTETARVVFGADRIAAGQVQLGDTGAARTPAAAIRAGTGFLSEDRKIEGIIPEMSVRENLTLVIMPQLARRGILDRARSNAIADRLIGQLGVRCASPEQPIRELSGGNQQKVLLARWLCMSPRLLILDEPTRGIDVGTKADILELIRELATKGLGVLMISSELEEIITAASRIFVLRDGCTVAEFAGDAMTETAVMAAMAHGHAVHAATHAAAHAAAQA